MTTTSPIVRKPSFAKATEGAALPTGVHSQTAIMRMSRSSKRAFTLVEIMVVVVLSGLILGGVMSTYIAVLKSSMRLWHYEKMEREANKGLEYFARDVRSARAINWSSSTSITLTVPQVSGGGDRTVIYSWNNGTKVFAKTENSVATPLVRDVQAFAFNRFNLLQAAAANDYETNQIQVTMTAAPATNGVYAESSKRVLSARYVLRNR
jgi:prepilin-type N-terminal cleavage/methylation domain-containing protein